MILSLLTELVSLTNTATKTGQMLKEGADAVKNNKDAINKIFGKAQTIASLAKKRIFEYPVVISNAFGDDIDIAFDLTRYAEASFAYFLLMSLNIEPVVEKGNTISAHLGKFSSELLNMEARIEIEGQSLSAEDISFIYEAYKAGLTPYAFAQDFVKYQASKEDIYDRIKSNQRAGRQEIIEEQGTGHYYDRETHQEVNEFGQYIDHNNNIILDEKGNPIQSTNYIEGKLDDMEFIPQQEIKLADSMKDKIGKTLPTTLTLNLYVGEHKVPVTIAVKAVPHFISSEEMSGIFKRCVEDGKLLSKIIRLTSGEISFFKDFLLNLKQIEEDKEMYVKLERHPWFRKILDQKIKSNVKGIGGLIKATNSFMSTGGGLPSLSLMTTANELSNAISYPFQEAIRKGKIDKIISKLMLLALLVYDQDKDLVFVFFNGIKDPQIFRSRDLKSAAKQTDMDKLIQVMQTMMIKNY